MSPFCVALIVLEKGGFIVHDQDEAEASNVIRDWEPIQAWEFYPIIIPLMESSLVSHPLFDKTLPVFHHIGPLMPVKIHIIF